MPAVCQLSGKQNFRTFCAAPAPQAAESSDDRRKRRRRNEVLSRASEVRSPSKSRGLFCIYGLEPATLPTAACGRKSAGLVLALLVRCIPTSRRRALQSLTALATRNCHPETPPLPFAGLIGSESEARLCRGVLGLLSESLLVDLPCPVHRCLAVLCTCLVLEALRSFEAFFARYLADTARTDCNGPRGRNNLGSCSRSFSPADRVWKWIFQLAGLRNMVAYSHAKSYCNASSLAKMHPVFDCVMQQEGRGQRPCGWCLRCACIA